VPVAGRVEVVLVKRRFACLEPGCPRRTFAEVSEQVPLRARVTTRLRQLVLDQVVAEGRAICRVAAEHGLGWWTVQGLVSAAALLLTDPDTIAVRRLGIDEHRYRSVRYFREPDGSWRRFEPWMSTIVDADTGQILGCAILGLEGGELMSMIEIAMLGKVPYPVLREAVFAHPTLAESLNTLFANFD
jgi:hypothetical protein